MENILQPWISWIKYIYMSIYYYYYYYYYYYIIALLLLLLLYNSSILHIEHSPYCILLGLTHTHKVI